MTHADRLITHAILLMYSEERDEELVSVNHRRAVSAAYYALFHQMSGDAAALLAPNVSESTNFRIQRWFDHGEMKRICTRFLPNTLDQPLRGLVGEAASPDLQFVAQSFINLQEARHKADYDLGFILKMDEVVQLVETALEAMQAWARVAKSAEANIFILSLLLWKNWDRERL